MKYPIDTNRYIESTRVLYGAKGEEVCRDYLIPAMNDAYRDGKAGAAGYPKDPAAEIAEYEAQRGPMSSDWGRRFTAAFIRCLNVSYAQGRRWPMGRKSQIKARAAELELARILQSHGYPVEAGRAQSYGEVPDLSGLPGIHIECKRAEALRLSEWMEQARRDAERFGDGLPAVFHRRSREGWRVTMALPDWLEVYRKLPTKKGD